jgi:tetratricopeptide (TPR) repeat protein
MDQANLFISQGTKYYQNQNYYEAIKCYTKSLNFNKNIETYRKRVESYIELGKHNQAIEDCKIIIKEDENFVKGYNLISYCYIQFSEFKYAMEWCNKFPDQSNKEIIKEKEHIKQIRDEYNTIVNKKKNGLNLTDILNLKKILKYVSKSIELQSIYNNILIQSKKYKTSLSIIVMLYKQIQNRSIINKFSPLLIKDLINNLNKKYSNKVLQQLKFPISFINPPDFLIFTQKTKSSTKSPPFKKIKSTNPLEFSFNPLKFSSKTTKKRIDIRNRRRKRRKGRK